MPAPNLGIEEIDRKYEVLEKLGEGGMGAVYKVRHRLLDELRVIKLIRSELEGREELQGRFLREAKVATQLRHPNIAQLFDFSIDEAGTAYIVMEFIDGKTLAELFAESGPLAYDDALMVADHCLAALAYLHDKQIIHRDIAPDNIMLVRDQTGVRAKLIDLGIAKPLESTHAHTRTGLFVGKVKYASPEAFSGAQDRPVEARSDLYSLGLVLYEALTGEFAIRGDDQVSIMSGHLFEAPRPFDETDPGNKVPPAVRTVILGALEKSAADRFGSAAEFRKALRDAAGPERFPAWVDHDKTVVAVPVDVAAARPRPAPVDKTVLLDSKTRRLGWLEGLGRLRALRLPRARLAGLGAAIVAAAALVAWWAVTRQQAPSLDAGAAPSERSSPRSGADGAAAADLSRIDYGTYHALVIGNNAYRELPRLETAAVDARTFAGVLEEKYGFRVTVLTDATRYEMITALTEIAESLTARDNLLIYYAGHGWLDAKNQSGYWQPVDAEPFNTANWISTRYEISAVLAELPARQVLIVADSCYSGSIGEPVEPAARLDVSDPGYATHVRQLLGRRSRLALTSGGLSPVLDTGDGNHSVFSKVLLEALDKNDTIVETSRLFPEIRDRVAAAAARFGADQDPQLSPIPQAGDEGGDFFFVPAGLG